jgi:hypothetical protein
MISHGTDLPEQTSVVVPTRNYRNVYDELEFDLPCIPEPSYFWREEDGFYGLEWATDINPAIRCIVSPGRSILILDFREEVDTHDYYYEENYKDGVKMLASLFPLSYAGAI